MPSKDKLSRNIGCLTSVNTDVTEPAGVNNFGMGVGEGNDIVEFLLIIHIITILKDQRSSTIKKSI